jgi:hypothetical protein
MMDSFLYIETAQRIQSKQPPSPVEAIQEWRVGREEKEKKKGKLGGFEWAREFDWDRRAVTAVTMAIRPYGTVTYCPTSACNAINKKAGEVERAGVFFDLAQCSLQLG